MITIPVLLFNVLLGYFFSPLQELDFHKKSICPTSLEVSIDGDSSIIQGRCEGVEGSLILLYVNDVMCNSTTLMKGEFVFSPAGVTIFMDDKICVSSQSIGMLESDRICK